MCIRVRIEHRPNMKKAGGSMTVIAYLEAQWPHDRIETRYIGWKLGRTDSSIFNKGNRFGRPFPAGKKRKTSLANGPYGVHLRRLSANRCPQAKVLFCYCFL